MIELQAGRERPGIRERLSDNHPLIRELKLKARVWSRGRGDGAVIVNFTGEHPRSQEHLSPACTH